jgi:hypothetical protein
MGPLLALPPYTTVFRLINSWSPSIGMGQLSCDRRCGAVQDNFARFLSGLGYKEVFLRRA